MFVYLCFLTYIFGDRQEGEIFTVVAFISDILESEKLLMRKSVAPGTCCIFDFKTEFFVPLFSAFVLISINGQRSGFGFS